MGPPPSPLKAKQVLLKVPPPVRRVGPPYSAPQLNLEICSARKPPQQEPPKGVLRRVVAKPRVVSSTVQYPRDFRLGRRKQSALHIAQRKRVLCAVCDSRKGSVKVVPDPCVAGPLHVHVYAKPVSGV